jgi:MFS family permease
LVVFALASIHILAGVFAAVASSDTSRDVFMAQQIASGQGWPLTGPAINGVVHLGPLWFYLLALPMVFVPSAAAVTGFMGLISASQFPLAYALGTQLRGREEGVLFALWLAFPGWVVTSFGSLTHPIMVIPSLLLGALCVLWYSARPGRWRALGLGAVLTLMCAAHPSLVLLGAIMLLACLKRAPDWFERALHALLMGLPVLLSLAPMVIEQWLFGAADGERVAAYARSDWSLPSLLAALDLVRAVAFHGPHYVLRYWLGLPPAVVTPIYGIYVSLLLVASIRLALQARRHRQDRALASWLVGLLLLQATFLAAIRDTMPPWMVYALWLMLAALLALGLGGLLNNRVARTLLFAFLGAGAMASSLAYARLNGTREFRDVQPYEGRHAFFDVRYYQDREAAAFWLPRMPFRQLFALGEVLCEPVTLYGHIAQQVEFTHAVSAAEVCGTTEQVRFGGPPEPDRGAWMGLQRKAWQALQAQPQRWISEMGLTRPGPVWHSPSGLSPVVPRFNALPRQLQGEATSFEVEGRASSASGVLVSHRAYRYLPFSVTRAFANGREVLPAYSDLTSAVFLPPPGDDEVHWRIQIRAVSNYVDVLAFERAGDGSETPR